MDSPARGDTRQGLKASWKHLEFQLQREKTYTRELEEKLKVQQALIAKLEQDKAELRRELIVLTDDEKKKTKLEEKCHTLQKELSEKQTALMAEQKRVTAAEYEKEQIRRDAHASIAKWCEAQKEWITENEILQKELDESREAHAKLKGEYEALVNTCDDVSRQLQREKEHCLRLESSAEITEKKIASLHSRVEALQNDICMRDETVFKLDEAGTKWQEICHAKDDEIKALEIQNTKLSDNFEKLQNTISTLNQRNEALNMLNMEEKGRSDKILCDLRELEKDKKLIQMELESVRRDFEHLSQNFSRQQEMVTDLRAKLTSLTEQLKERTSELRKQELTISQLTADLKQVERERTDDSHILSTQQNQIQKLYDTLEEAKNAAKTIQEEKSLLEVELQQMRATHEARDETVVLMKSELEDRIEGLLVDIKRLECQVDERQQMIDNIMNQLEDANTRNKDLYRKVSKESDAFAQLREFVEELQEEKNGFCFEQLIREERISRVELHEQCLDELAKIFLQQSAVTCNLSIRYSEEVFRLGNIVRELDAEKIITMNQLNTMRTDWEEKLRFLSESEARHTSEIEAKNMEIARLQETTRECEENLMLLKEELQAKQKLCETSQDLEKAVSERLVEAERRLQQMSTTSEKQSCSLYYAMGHFDKAIQLLMFYCENYILCLPQKMDIVLLEFDNIYAREIGGISSELTTLKNLHEESEERCAHLHLMLKDTESRLEEQKEALTKQSERFVMKIRLADNQRNLAEKAKEDLLRKCTSLTEQLQSDSNTKDGKIKELLVQLDAEKHSSQLIEAKVEKLRKRLDYELGRKEDYKRALEEVKLRREESERYRATEKDWAMKAINRANNEVNYWVNSFEKLKSMLDDLSNRSGARVSAVDQAAIKKFEEAKDRMKIKDQEVNTSSSEVVGCRHEKRARIE